MANEKQKLVVSDSTYNRARKKTENGKSRSEMYEKSRENTGGLGDFYSSVLQGMGTVGQGIDSFNTGLGNIIDKGFDNTIGALINNVTNGAVDPRQWLSGEGVGTGLDLAEDLGLFAASASPLAPIALPLLGVKSFSQNADTMNEGLTGMDLETGEQLSDEQKALKNLAGYGNFALMMLPGGIGKGAKAARGFGFRKPGTGAFSKASENIKEAINESKYLDDIKLIGEEREAAIARAEAGVDKSIADRANEIAATPGRPFPPSMYEYGVPRYLKDAEVKDIIRADIKSKNPEIYSDEILAKAPEAEQALERLVNNRFENEAISRSAQKPSLFDNPVYTRLKNEEATFNPEETGWAFRPSVQQASQQENFSQFADSLRRNAELTRASVDDEIDTALNNILKELDAKDTEIISTIDDIVGNEVKLGEISAAEQGSANLGSPELTAKINNYIQDQTQVVKDAARFAKENNAYKNAQARMKGMSNQEKQTFLQDLQTNYPNLVGTTGNGKNLSLIPPTSAYEATVEFPTIAESYGIKREQLERVKKILEEKKKLSETRKKELIDSAKDIDSIEASQFRKSIESILGNNTGINAYIAGASTPYAPGYSVGTGPTIEGLVNSLRGLKGIDGKTLGETQRFEELLSKSGLDDALKREAEFAEKQQGYNELATELGIRDLENATDADMRRLMIRNMRDNAEKGYRQELSSADLAADEKIAELASEEARIATQKEGQEIFEQELSNALRRVNKSGSGLNFRERWAESQDELGSGIYSLLPGYGRKIRPEIENPIQEAQRIGELLHEPGGAANLTAKDLEFLDAYIGMGNSNPQAQFLTNVMAGGKEGLGLNGKDADALFKEFKDLGAGARAAYNNVSRAGKSIEKKRGQTAEGARSKYNRKAGVPGTILGLPADWAAMAGQGYLNAAAEYGPENTNQMIAQNPGLFASMALAGLLGRPFARRLPTLTGRRQMGPTEFGYKVSNVPYRMMAASALGQNLSNQQVVDDGSAAGQAIENIINEYEQYKRGYQAS